MRKQSTTQSRKAPACAVRIHKVSKRSPLPAFIASHLANHKGGE